MEAVLMKRREIFFNNLILLGLDRVSLEKKHGITFHKDMFVLPNKKGFEIVTYFLFSKLSSATGKDYNIPWPLVCKEHDRLFQKTCYSHLMNFSQENCVKFPRIFPSLLSSFGGDRLYKIYLAFSSYVLYKTIKKDKNSWLLSVPSVNPENFSTAKEILQLSTILNMKTFRSNEMISYSSYKIWLKFTKLLEESLRKLKLLLKSYDELTKKQKSRIFSLFPDASDGSFNLSKIIEKCFESLKPVLKQRKTLDKFLSSEERYWQYLCSEVGENAENEFLNGQDYRIQVSDFLPEEYIKELKSAGCLSSDENGKLSIERFLKIFMMYCTFIVDLLKKANLNQLQKNCFVENATAIEDDLQCIINLNKKLSDEVIPDVKKNIEKLKILSDYDDIEDNMELSSDLFCLLPDPSYDVQSVKQRTSHFDPNLEKLFNSSLDKQLCSKKDDSGVSLNEKYPVEYSLTSLTDQNFSRKDSSSFISNSFSENEIVTKSSKLEESSQNNDFKMPAVPLFSKIDISSLDDLDFSRSTHFKMRESWLKEESLDSMTLPDISFDE